MSGDGSIIPLIPESVLKSLPLHPSSLMAAVKQELEAGEDKDEATRGISVIQRAPPAKLDQPKIILERRTSATVSPVSMGSMGRQQEMEQKSVACPVSSRVSVRLPGSAFVSHHQGRMGRKATGSKVTT